MAASTVLTASTTFPGDEAAARGRCQVPHEVAGSLTQVAAALVSTRRAILLVEPLPALEDVVGRHERLAENQVRERVRPQVVPAARGQLVAGPRDPGAPQP